MKTSAQGRALIRACEDCRLTAYRDAVNVWTIGVGHTTAAGAPAVTAGMTITDAQAGSILANDLAACERDVARLVTVPLNQGQFDAMASWVFNLGAGNLSKSTLLNRLNAGDYAAAADEILKWNRAGGKVLNGLTKRRKAEKLMFEGKTDEALRLVGATVAMPAPSDVEPVPPKPAIHPAAKTTAAAGGFFVGLAAATKVGAPLWACLSIAFIVAVAVYLVIHNRSK